MSLAIFSVVTLFMNVPIYLKFESLRRKGDLVIASLILTFTDSSFILECFFILFAVQKSWHWSNQNNFFDSSSSSASPESGLGTSHSSLPGSGQGSTNDQHINDDMYYDTEPIQPLGTCKALYPFDGEFGNVWSLRTENECVKFHSHKWGKHPNGGRRRTARDRTRPRRWMDPRSPHHEWQRNRRRFRSYELHREHALRVGTYRDSNTNQQRNVLILIFSIISVLITFTWIKFRGLERSRRRIISQCFLTHVFHRTQINKSHA